jgi:hypothetical protein
VEKTPKMIRIPKPLKTALECICNRKGISEAHFIMSAIDEKVKREKNDYREE